MIFDGKTVERRDCQKRQTGNASGDGKILAVGTKSAKESQKDTGKMEMVTHYFGSDPVGLWKKNLYSDGIMDPHPPEINTKLPANNSDDSAYFQAVS